MSRPRQVMKLPYKSKIKILEEGRSKKDPTGKWYRVQTENNHEGWIYAGDSGNWLVRDVQKAEKNYQAKIVKEMLIGLLKKGQDERFYLVPLSSAQASSLDQILDETLLRASVLIAQELKQSSSDDKGFRSALCTAPKTRSIDIMDLDQNGQPEVYTTVETLARWAGKACSIKASILATWSNGWRVLRRSTYMTECPWFLVGGDDISASQL